jgi:hypothetical protein
VQDLKGAAKAVLLGIGAGAAVALVTPIDEEPDPDEQPAAAVGGAA